MTNAFDIGFTKRAQEAGFTQAQAQRALFVYKQADAAVSGKGMATSGQNLGDSHNQHPLQAPGMQKAPPSPGMQSLQARSTLPMPQPQLGQQMQPMQGPPAPQPMLKPQLATQMQPQQGPPMQMPQQHPMPIQPPMLNRQMAAGPIRPKLMPQMNQPMITN